MSQTEGFDWSKTILIFVHCSYKNESVCAKVGIFIKPIRSPLRIENKKCKEELRSVCFSESVLISKHYFVPLLSLRMFWLKGYEWGSEIVSVRERQCEQLIMGKYCT